MGERIYTLFHAVTPSDTDPPAPFPVNGLYVGSGAGGNLVLLDARGVTTTFVVPAGVDGFVLPVAPRRVLAATTVINVVALGNVRVGSF